MSGFKQFVGVIVHILFSVVDALIHQLFRCIYGRSRIKAPPIKDLLLLDSATKIAFKIRTKKIKCADVIERFISRIEVINPVLNCVVDNIFEEAREEARKVDKLLESGLVSEDVLAKEKPFLGVPFTTKDAIAVKGMIQTSGIVTRKDIIAEEDATAVANLKSAGAIPIALTNVSELCMWWESHNHVHGRTRNPYDTCRTVGGSSGGEGCIQAAAGSAFGVGSDIGGSIRIPAVFNGVFGHKPSPFIVSNDGQYPVPYCQDLHLFLGIGPICRHAEDLTPLLKVLSGDNAEKLRLDDKVDIKDINVFYQEDNQGSILVSSVNKEIRSLFRKVATYFEKAHMKKIKKLELPRFRKGNGMWFCGMKTESGPTFQQQLTNLKGDINVAWELLKWVVRCSNFTFIALVTAFVDKRGFEYGDPRHVHYLTERDNLKKELLGYLGDNGVLIYPTHPTVAPYHNEPIFKPFNFSYTSVINVLGLPATHIPMGLNSEGIPMGLQVIATPNNDRLCLAIAKELEKAFGGWVPPDME